MLFVFHFYLFCFLVGLGSAWRFVELGYPVARPECWRNLVGFLSAGPASPAWTPAPEEIFKRRTGNEQVRKAQCGLASFYFCHQKCWWSPVFQRRRAAKPHDCSALSPGSRKSDGSTERRANPWPVSDHFTIHYYTFISNKLYTQGKNLFFSPNL